MTGSVAIPSFGIDFDGHVYQEKLHHFCGADVFRQSFGLTEPALTIGRFGGCMVARMGVKFSSIHRRDLVKIEFST